ncbi:hypothetical protein K491DRAFT_480966 [Lophiostoma macrostomum CBS 122681]|uniref:Uncharacterized protein n=1 Tax=Lophiostoma macrostomum CBS 122681 TaxID=1314788 RepID=A0A6A6TMB5_9PLEO|nr:hypothetical protein K491DRAFT_480966 [Lophiostoma macrostomum CBS 122681]
MPLLLVITAFRQTHKHLEQPRLARIPHPVPKKCNSRSPAFRICRWQRGLGCLRLICKCTHLLTRVRKRPSYQMSFMSMLRMLGDEVIFRHFSAVVDVIKYVLRMSWSYVVRCSIHACTPQTIRSDHLHHGRYDSASTKLEAKTRSSALSSSTSSDIRKGVTQLGNSM